MKVGDDLRREMRNLATGGAVEGLRPEIAYSVLGDGIDQRIAAGEGLNYRTEIANASDARVQIQQTRARAAVQGKNRELGLSQAGDGINDVNDQGKTLAVW